MELDREDFRLWLAAKDADEYAGESNLPMGCPLSTYLYERLGIRCSVHPGGFEVRPGAWMEAPLWATSFMAVVDARPSGEVEVINAKHALTILDSIIDPPPIPDRKEKAS